MNGIEFDKKVLATIAFGLAGCATEYLPTDSLNAINRHIAANFAAPPFQSADVLESTKKLWRDYPAFDQIFENSSKRNSPLKCVTFAKPVYPVGPLEDGATARVTVSAIVGTSGTVVASRILSSSNLRFNYSALQCANRAKFSVPSTEKGPSEVVINIPIQYKISK